MAWAPFTAWTRLHSDSTITEAEGAAPQREEHRYEMWAMAYDNEGDSAGQRIMIPAMEAASQGVKGGI